MRKGDKVFYLYGDHLGSTSLATDESGEVIYKAGYLPYGGERLSTGISPTDFGFTDQRNEVGLGLMDYNARYYDPYLSRFISPDRIVPEPENPQAWNRYSYANNNPVKYIDPSGHVFCVEDEGPCRNPIQFEPIKLNSTGSKALDWLSNLSINAFCGITGGWCKVENDILQPTSGLEFAENSLTSATFGMVVPMKPGAATFKNLLSSSLDDELATASRVGVKSIAGDVSDEAFSQLANRGETLKWAIDASGNLRVVPKYGELAQGSVEISHAVLFEGAEVAAAGEMQLVVHEGQAIVLQISNHTGHYETSAQSLRWAVDELRNAGWNIADEVVEEIVK